MSYEIAQNLLTTAAEFIALAGLTGIITHAIWSQHQHFMTTYCPLIAPYQPEVQEAISPIPDHPQTTVEQASEPTDASTHDHPEIDLNALDPTILRKLCTQYEITWKHCRGKGKHATKSMMVYQLQQRLTA
jgi:hypothetical protein